MFGDDDANARLKERVALTLGCATSALEDGINGIAGVNHRSPALRLFPPRLEDEEVVVLVAANDAGGSSVVRVLEDATRRDHAALLTVGRPLRYAVIFKRRTKRDSCGAGFGWAGLRRDAEIARSEEADVGLGEDDGSSSQSDRGGVLGEVHDFGVEVFPIDVQHSAAHLQHRAARELLTRQSAAIDTVRQVARQLDNGIASVDSAGALGAASAWVVDATEEINRGFSSSSIAIADAMEAALENGAASAASTPGLALALVEAVLKRHTALNNVLEFADCADGPMRKVARAVPPGIGAAETFEQRIASLRLEAEHAATEALALSPLARPLLTLKLHDAARRQSVETIANELVERIAVVIALCAAILPPPNVAASQRIVTSAFFQQQLLPAVGFDLVTTTDALIAPHRVFEPRTPNPEDTIDLDTGMPLCALDPVVQQMKAAEEMLRRWLRCANRAAAVLREPSSAIHAAQTVSLTAEDSHLTNIPVAYAAYAADRCAALADICQQVEAQGGILTPQVLCLYRTMHRAANIFPVLRSHHHRNWELLVDTFERTLALRYDIVDEGVEFSEIRATVAAPAAAPCAPARAADAPSVIRCGEDEEKATLRCRVTLLGRELEECRGLLKAAEQRVATAHAATALVEQQNGAMRSQLEACVAELAAVRGGGEPLGAVEQNAAPIDAEGCSRSGRSEAADGAAIGPASQSGVAERELGNAPAAESGEEAKGVRPAAGDSTSKGHGPVAAPSDAPPASDAPASGAVDPNFEY